MKSIYCSLAALVAPVMFAAEVPKVLQYLPQKEFVKAATVSVDLPKELDQYVAIVQESARKNPEWFKEQSKKASPGVPLPYHENLGLTKEQYDDYLKLWMSREFKNEEPVILYLRPEGDNSWAITTPSNLFGIPTPEQLSPLTTLKYNAEEDVFFSPNGKLKRLEDVDADELSVLGKWTGHEWKYEEETSLGKTKENFAIGKTGDGKYGLLVYRFQEVSTAGTPLQDDSVVVRFPMGEAGILKPQTKGGQ